MPPVEQFHFDPENRFISLFGLPPDNADIWSYFGPHFKKSNSPYRDYFFSRDEIGMNLGVQPDKTNQSSDSVLSSVFLFTSKWYAAKQETHDPDVTMQPFLGTLPFGIQRDWGRDDILGRFGPPSRDRAAFENDVMGKQPASLVFFRDGFTICCMFGEAGIDAVIVSWFPKWRAPEGWSDGQARMI